MPMTDEARQALRLRLAGAKASIKKLPKILEQLSDDDRLRNLFAFSKAHTHRWAGKGAQPQNLKAPRTKEEKALVSAVVKMLEDGKPVPDLDALSLALRPLITAPAGKQIVVADFKSVEDRVLMWAAGCEPGMDVYRKGLDPYIDFSARMEGVDYSEVTAEMRQQAKPAKLGAGFGLGGGQLVRKCVCAKDHPKQMWNVRAEVNLSLCPVCMAEVQPGLVQKTGLWRYAEMMGIDLSQERAQAQVQAFREVFEDVANFWFYTESAFAGCCNMKRDQFISSSLGCKLVFRWKPPALRVVLPSGVELVYNNAFAYEERTTRGKKLTIGFEAARGHGWGVHHTYGGKLTENIVQAIARDCLVEALFAVEADGGLETVGLVHDEIICLADESDKTALDRLIGYMSVTPEWAPGLLLAADGAEGRRYAK